MTLVMGDNFSEIFFLKLPINDTHAKIYLLSSQKTGQIILITLMEMLIEIDTYFLRAYCRDTGVVRANMAAQFLRESVTYDNMFESLNRDQGLGWVCWMTSW